MALRFDTRAIRADKIERSANGAIRVPAELTASGVFTYQDSAGKSFREWRPPEEVARADALASIEDVPVTIGHPPEGVTPATYEKLSAGHVRAGSVKMDGAVAVGTLVIARKDALDRVVARDLVDTSMGYACRIDETAGTTPDGQPYDRVQRDMRYEHIALLKRGDARLGTALRLDSAGDQVAPACCADCEEKRGDASYPWDQCVADQMAEYGDEETAQRVCASIKEKYGDSMKVKIKRDGKELEVLGGSAEHIEYLEAQAKDAAARADKSDAELARRDSDARAKARADLEAKARTVLGDEWKPARKDGDKEVALTDREIKEAVILRRDASVELAGKADAYVDVRFDDALNPKRSDATKIATSLETGGEQTDAFKRADEIKKGVSDAWKVKA